MKAQSFCLQLTTKKAPEFIDITTWVSECVAKSKVNNGFAVVYSKHTTAAIKINENEPLLLQDMANFLEQFSPRNGKLFVAARPFIGVTPRQAPPHTAGSNCDSHYTKYRRHTCEC